MNAPEKLATKTIFFHIFFSILFSLQIQQVAQNGEIANFRRNIRSGVGTVYIYIYIYIVFFPLLCALRLFFIYV